MIESRWNDVEAREFVARYGERHGEDVALRVYTSRLIGQDRDLVLHGGGNTSVKTTVVDVHGEALPVIAVKGSGRDLATVEPSDLPLMELLALRRLTSLATMTDELVVHEVRRRLLDPTSPDPSLETLVHAALTQKFVDHTHADAILVLTNQPDGEATVREALGEGVAILPWIKPGFPLAKAVAKVCANSPHCEGIVLLHHGVFTFGDDARTSYERTIELVARAERFIAERGGDWARPAVAPGIDGLDLEAEMVRVTRVVRGAVAVSRGSGVWSRLIGSWRHDSRLRSLSRDPECPRLVALGPLTPDHVIRTKAQYLFLTREEAGSAAACREKVNGYAARYRAYFDGCSRPGPTSPAMLDPHPQVVVVEGLGLLAFGDSHAAAEIAADIGAHTLVAKAAAEAIGAYTPLSERELFEIEYWSLEQAKLATERLPLAGQVALVTGGAGAIGCGVCESLVAAGATVIVADLDRQAAQDVIDTLVADHPLAALVPVGMDVTDVSSVSAGFAAATLAFGGVDIVVANAGVAHVSSLRDMSPGEFRRVIDVNLSGTMTVLQEAARLFEAQGTGGAVVVQASKNVFAPSANFGAYSASKAGQHQLGKIAAMEFAPLGVRVNMINADAVFGDRVASGLWAEVGPDRMAARGLDADGLKRYYRDRCLLKIEVTPRHVGAAVVFLVSDESSATTGVTLTVDGGVAGAFPR